MADGAGVRRVPRWLITGMVIALVVPLAIFVVISLLLDDTTTPVATDDVVADFRDDATTTPIAPTPTPDTPDSLTVAAAGVYVYETTGRESIDALGGASHDYPAETTVTVRSTDCGATYRWVAIEERSELMDVCAIDGALALRGYVADHEFFSQGDNKPLTCDAPVVLLAPGREPGVTTGVCRGAGLVEELTVVVLAPESVTVGPEVVQAVPVQINVVVGPPDGHTQGASTTRLLIDPVTGVLVGWSEATMTTADSQVGSVDYEETFELQLTSLEPRT